MMQKLRNLSAFAGPCFSFAAEYLAARKKSVSCLKKISPQNYISDNNRIIGYAAKVSCMAGNFISYLINNRKLNKKEFTRICAAGAITPMYDDLFDKNNLTKTELLTYTLSPEKIKNDKFYLYKDLLNWLQNAVDDRKVFQSVCTSVYNAQLRDRDGITNSRKALEQCYAKGSVSFEFYAYCLAGKIKDNQKKTIADFGGYIQLIDDIFDVIPDFTAGNYTFTTINLTRPEIIRCELARKKQLLISDINSYDLSMAGKKRIKSYIYILSAPAFSYLHWLEKNKYVLTAENLNKEKFSWKGWKKRDFIFFFSYLSNINLYR